MALLLSFRYFPYIFNMSGARASYEKYGSWFSYDGAPRAQMFKRDHSKVVDMDSMMKLMRCVCKAVGSCVITPGTGGGDTSEFR